MKKLLHVLIAFITINISAQVPNLNSLVGSNHVIFLDFDGHTINGTSWNSYNGGNPIFATHSGFNNTDIEYIFNIVAEDYKIFNLNVTTDSTVFWAAPLQQRVRVLITNTSAWYPGVGGVAQLGSFSNLVNNICFVFPNRLAGNKGYVAEACSHEAGHTLGINHHSEYNTSAFPCTKTNDYQYQIGSGEICWAPIMGVGYYANQTTWSNIASSFNCNNVQNDFTTITSTNNRGVAFKNDDHGDTYLSATSLNVIANNFIDSGIILNNSDTDFFQLNLAAEALVNLNITPWNLGTGNVKANLDAQLSIYDASCAIIKSINLPTILNAGINNLLLPAGIYYFGINGVANQNNNGFGSVGEYFITGSIDNNIPLTLTANFLVNDSTLCVGSGTDFYSQSTGTPTTYAWTFTGGTPSTSNVQNPKNIVFNTSGNYQVSLTIGNGVTSNTKTVAAYIRVQNNPTISITSSAPKACGNSSISLKANSATAKIYDWSGNTGLSNYYLPTTEALVTSPTTYTVKGTDLEGCQSTASIFMDYFPKPVLVKTPNVNNLTACRLDSTVLSVSGALTYSWSPTTGLDNSNTNTVKANVYSGNRTYTVTGTDINNCSSNAFFTINSRKCDSLEAFANIDTSVICGGGCVNIQNNSTGNPDVFEWSFPGGTPSSFNGVNPGLVCYSTSGNYNVSLKIYKAGNLDTSTKVFSNFVLVKTNPIITINATPINICIGDSATIKLSGASNYTFTPDSTLRIVRFDSAIVKPTVTTTYYIRGSKFEFNNGGGGTLGGGSEGAVSYKYCNTDTSVTIFVANPCGTLNNQILSFNAYKQNDKIILNWQFANTSLSNFYIERSVDGTNFTPITNNGFNYMLNTFTDATLPNSNVIYYRLTWKDNSGNLKLSNTIVINNLQKDFISAWPNPTTNLINITYKNHNNLPTIIKLLNTKGVLLNKILLGSSTNGINVTSINIEQYPSGIYFIQYINGNEHKFLKVIKQ